jgi:hypothetical protein
MNKLPPVYHTDPNTGHLIYRYAFTQTVYETDCPKCGEKAGDPCRTTKGKRTFPPHLQRRKTYADNLGPEEFNSRHSVQVGPDEIARIESIQLRPGERSVPIITDPISGISRYFLY